MHVNIDRRFLCLLCMQIIFKTVNDRYGHVGGDMALKFIAETLQKFSKGSDYAFRIGGEEFLLLLVDSDLSRAKTRSGRKLFECV